MNPQCGYYQNQSNQQSRNYMMNYGSTQRNRQQTYGGGYGTGPNPECRPGTQGRSCSSRVLPTRTRSSYGGSSTTPARSPPVFSSPSSRSLYGNNGYQQSQPQQPWTSGRSNGGGVGQAQQAVGRSCVNGGSRNYQNQQPMQQQHPLAPAQYCTPQAIKVNITAEQLENAKNKPFYQDRGEASGDENSNVKYITLNWQDLLGGMENLRVSMAPSSDSSNQNRQLKVSFGGQKSDPVQAGETALKVVSIEPATTERMGLQKGNAFAGSMKICDPPSHLRMTPTATAQTNRFIGNCYGASGQR